MSWHEQFKPARLHFEDGERPWPVRCHNSFSERYLWPTHDWAAVSVRYFGKEVIWDQRLGADRVFGNKPKPSKSKFGQVSDRASTGLGNSFRSNDSANSTNPAVGNW